MGKNQKKLITIFFFSCLAILLNIGTGHAAPCTAGVDCYCDKVKTVGNPIYDASLLMCEDFEAPTLVNNQGVGAGAPWYGPPYDGGSDRGSNGYWNRVYGEGVVAALWSQGQPANPLFGVPCGFSLCTGLKIWSVGDKWGGNNYAPLAAFLRNGEYTAEPGLTAPTHAAGGGSGSFDGSTSLFSRVPSGPNAAGIFGNKYWAVRATFGITAVVAYASNLFTNGPTIDFWKGDEWVPDRAFGGGDGLLLFGRPQNVSNNTFPFYQFTFSRTDTQATCNTKLAAATKTKGSISCSVEGALIMEASTADYHQSVDWPLATWGCVRGYYQNMGLANSSIQIWFMGPSGVEVKLIDVSGMDTRGQAPGAKGGYEGFAWNNYANANQPGGTGPTTQASGRYQDNYHIRAGAPVSCSQIGYASSGGDIIPPAAPTGLRIL